MPHLTLLQKEMDYIEGTVKNLDDIIHKTKNFAFLTWGGSLYLIAGHLEDIQEYKLGLYLLTAVIPVLYWIMDYRWRKHLLQCGMRKQAITNFINSTGFRAWVKDPDALPEKEQFPLYDPVGWHFTRSNFPQGAYASQYLVDDSSLVWQKVAFYKDAYLFYGAMIVLSIAFSIFYVSVT